MKALLNTLRKYLLVLEPMFKVLKQVNRHTVFLVLAILLVISLLLSKNKAILEFTERATKMDTYERRAFQYVQDLPPGSVVLLSADYGPSTRPEAEPIAAAFIKHCFKRDIKVVTMGLWPDGAQLISTVIEKIAIEYGKKKNVDWVHLGYSPGGVVVIKQMFIDFKKVFPRTADGISTYDIPILKDIRTAKDFALIFSVSAGDPGVKTYVKIANGEYGQVVIGGVTAVSAPEIYPYLHTGQLMGLWAGLKGAATYEFAIKEPSVAAELMFPQSVIHITIVLFIITGNLVMLYDKYVKKL